MTEKEAIKYLEIMKLSTEDNSVGEIQKEMYDIAIKALEKQMPKKPERRVTKEDLRIGNCTFKAGTEPYYCPQCKKIIVADTYCRWCGQAIDWSKKE